MSLLLRVASRVPSRDSSPREMVRLPGPLAAPTLPGCSGSRLLDAAMLSRDGDKPMLTPHRILAQPLALAGCGWQGPALEGHAGLQRQVISYYDDRATERNFACPNPRMQSVTSSQVVEDTPESVVMDVRYYRVDWSQASEVGGGNVTTCRDWSERTFTFARASDGQLGVVGMTGPAEARLILGRGKRCHSKSLRYPGRLTAPAEIAQSPMSIGAGPHFAMIEPPVRRRPNGPRTGRFK